MHDEISKHWITQFYWLQNNKYKGHHFCSMNYIRNPTANFFNIRLLIKTTRGVSSTTVSGVLLERFLRKWVKGDMAKIT